MKLGGIGCGGIIVLMILIGILASIIGGSDEVTTTSDVGVSAENLVPHTPVPVATPTPREIIIDSVVAALGKSNRDVQGAASQAHRVQVVSLSEEGQITIQWSINNNLTSSLRNRGAKMDVVALLKSIHESQIPYDDVLLVGTYSLVDKLGNAEEKSVVTAPYSRAIIEKINWSNFLTDNAYLISDGEFGALLHRDFRD